LKTNTCRGG